MSAPFISCDADLEKAVGARPPGAMLKSVDHLDEHCHTYLARSPFAVLGVVGAEGAIRTVAVGGEPGFASPVNRSALDVGHGFAEAQLGPLPDGTPVGLIALVPGFGETLRVNGRVHAGQLRVDEAFLHCAKSIVRSELWADPAAAGEPLAPSEDGSDPSADDVDQFLADTPFVLLSSVDASGRADISPKGDPRGLVHRLDTDTFAIADRPGNRRTDTLHNLMSCDALGLLALRPGHDEVIELRGRARVSTDPALLDTMRLRDRTPKAAIVLDVHHRERRTEQAIAEAHLWDPARHVAAGDLPTSAAIWTDHVRRNTTPGLGAKIARRLVNQRATAAGVAFDYKRNL